MFVYEFIKGLYEMNVMYASDKNYVPVCIASMASLLENNKECEKIQIFLFGEGLEDREEKIKKLVHKYGRRIEIIQAEPIVRYFKRMNVPKVNGSYSAYVRLAASLRLKDIDKFIYVDCDTLVLHSLGELWNINIDEYALGAVCDGMTARCNLALGKRLQDLYINSGVLLVNAKYWRENDVLEIMINDLKKYKLNYTATGSDQEMINFTLSEKIYKLPLKYNVLVQNRIYDPKKMRFMIEKDDDSYYSISEMEKAKEDPYIVHFANSSLIRPWFSNTHDSLSDLWDYYLSLSDYKYHKIKFNVSMWQKVCAFAYFILPKGVYAVLKRYEDRLKHYYVRTYGR